MVDLQWIRIGCGVLAVALSGCGPSADTPCTPACGAGFGCYFGICVPDEDASMPPDGRDDARREDAGGDEGGTVTPGKLDLLFVVDDSGSMGEAQRLLADAFPLLLDALFTPPEDPTTGDPEYPAVDDLHVGVISSDMGTGSFVVPTCSGNDDGRLLHEPVAGVSGCAATYPAYLTATTPGAAVAHDFACIATLGTNGCGFEQPLGAMHKALTVHMAPGGPDAAFLRADAALAVVVLTDENDCSTDDSSMFDPSGPTPLQTRCFDHPDLLTPVVRYATGLDGARPSGRYAVAFLVGVPPGLSSCNTTGDLISPCLADASMRERINPSTGQVQTVCENGGVRATPGIRHVELATELGRRAVVRSICDPGFETFFAQLAEMAQTAR
ncbi:MAG: hypothetical protein JXB32_17740 [Deltaproteobacteria bacterium]|nr:hypothetical protein [Deltaproteobacteria bacterium]